MHRGYQRTIVPNKNRKIPSQKNHLTKIALGESSGVEIQASTAHHRHHGSERPLAMARRGGSDVHAPAGHLERREARTAGRSLACRTHHHGDLLVYAVAFGRKSGRHSCTWVYDAGIAISHVLGFVIAQLIGAGVAAIAARVLFREK